MNAATLAAVRKLKATDGTFLWQPGGVIGLHYIDFMVVTLVTSVIAALAFNSGLLKQVFGGFKMPLIVIAMGGGVALGAV